MDQPSRESGRKVYTDPAAMEPLLLPAGRDTGEMEELAFDLARAAAALAGRVHPITRQGIVEVVRSMNSYYSNLIEGHATHPLDIEKALGTAFSADSAKRALQLESRAHIEVQRLIEETLRAQPDTKICSDDFIRWIHREFYRRLPPEFHFAETEDGRKEPVIGGELRAGEVSVHRHIPPHFGNLPDFLRRFASAYEPDALKPLERIVAAAASHHRLAWIHPFQDGNGRVTRLFTHAYLIKSRIDSHGLWMVSRGLSRSRDQYMAALGEADARRQGDFDGRGNLSTKGLKTFCRFFLCVAADQVKFMSDLLEFDSMNARLGTFAKIWARETGGDFVQSISGRIGFLLGDLFSRGELTRGEATSILSIPERTAWKVTNQLIEARVITTEGPRKPLRLGFPTHLLGYYFPRLYPQSIELDLQQTAAAPTEAGHAG